jgi:hypothetical protein
MSKLRPDRTTDLVRIHQRVPERYVRASNRACVDCGQPAYHLSLKRETDRFGDSSFVRHGGTPRQTSVLLEDYERRCRKYHLTQDRSCHHRSTRPGSRDD